MAQMIPNRSENDIKNKWNSMKRKEERLRRNKVIAILSGAGLKKPPSAVAGKTKQAEKSNSKKKVTFAVPQQLPVLDGNHPVFDGAEEDTIMADSDGSSPFVLDMKPPALD